MLVRLRLQRPGLMAEAVQSIDTVDLVPKKRVVPLRPGNCSSPKSSAFRGPKMKSGTRDIRPSLAAGGWPGTWDTYATAYQPLTSHEAASRRASNGRQGAGKRVHPPGTEHPPRAILAVHGVDHLDHLVRRSSQRAKLLLRLSKWASSPSFSTGLALSCVDSLRPQGTQG